MVRVFIVFLSRCVHSRDTKSSVVESMRKQTQYYRPVLTKAQQCAQVLTKACTTIRDSSFVSTCGNLVFFCCPQLISSSSSRRRDQHGEWAIFVYVKYVKNVVNCELEKYTLDCSSYAAMNTSLLTWLLDSEFEGCEERYLSHR